MKKIILFVFLFLPVVLNAQRDSTRRDSQFSFFVGKGSKKTFHHVPKDTIKHKQRQKLKLDFSYELGIQNHALLRNHHFPMDTTLSEINLGTTNSDLPAGHVGSTYKPTFGYHTTITCDYKLKRNFRIESGLQLYYRQEIRIEDTDTIERNIVNNYNLLHYSSLDTFKSFQNSYFDIIVPVYFGYSFKRFSVLIGFKLPLYTFAKLQSTTLHDYAITYNKFNQFFYDSGALSLKFEYLITDKKLNVSSYLAIDDRGDKYFDFLLGLKIKFCSLK